MFGTARFDACSAVPLFRGRLSNYPGVDPAKRDEQRRANLASILLSISVVLVFHYCSCSVSSLKVVFTFVVLVSYIHWLCYASNPIPLPAVLYNMLFCFSLVLFGSSAFIVPLFSLMFCHSLVIGFCALLSCLAASRLVPHFFPFPIVFLRSCFFGCLFCPLASSHTTPLA